MKKRIATFLLAIGCLAMVQLSPVFAEGEGIAVNDTNFPDDNFRSFITENYDLDSDGSLSQEELGAVTVIDIKFDENIGSIQDITGIEYFTNLTELICWNQKLTTLDLSKNLSLQELQCQGNYDLTELDLSANTQLTGLCFTSTGISEIDLPQHSKLEWVECQYTEITSLNLSDAQNLKTVNCSVNYELTALNLDGCTALESLDYRQCNLKTLDLSDCSALSVLAGDRNYSLADIEFPANCENLTQVMVGSTAISELNISYAPKLQTLGCNGTGITELDLSGMPELRWLDCYANKLTALNLSGNPKLEHLDCCSSGLTYLDISQNINLTEVSCYNNNLTELDTSRNRDLVILLCYSNKITSLDLSQNTKLQKLNCQDNALAYLDLSQNSSLQTLACDSRQIVKASVYQDRSGRWVLDLADLVGANNASRLSNIKVIGGKVISGTQKVQFNSKPTAKNIVSYVYDIPLSADSPLENQTMTVRVVPQASSGAQVPGTGDPGSSSEPSDNSGQSTAGTTDKSAETADEMNLTLILLIMIVSGAGLTALFMERKLRADR